MKNARNDVAQNYRFAVFVRKLRFSVYSTCLSCSTFVIEHNFRIFGKIITKVHSKESGKLKVENEKWKVVLGFIKWALSSS